MSVVVAIDEEDRVVGLVEKRDAHVRGVLHRAFSVFVFRWRDGYEVLLRRRAEGKYHSGGLWSNTCCSHAEVGVDVGVTARKRLREEMGFDCELRLAGSFMYRKEVGGGLIEHELDYVFVGVCDAVVSLNREEACEFRWARDGGGEGFTVWFDEAFKIAKGAL